MHYACRIIQHLIEAYSTAIILMHVFKRLCMCVCMCCSHTTLCVCVRQCTVCHQIRGGVNVAMCYLFCVCFSVCADRQLLLRTFKCLLIAAIT